MRNQVKKILGDTLARCQKEGKLAVPSVSSYTLERPKVADHGDYAANIAFELSKLLKQPPLKIAQTLVGNLVDPAGLIKSITVAGSGFINITLTDQAWQSSLLDIDKAGGKWAHFEEGKGKKVNIEFVSGNPTGPLHIGNARGGPLGDVIASLLERNGYQVTREYYVNDVGGQVEQLGQSILIRCQRKSQSPSAPEVPSKAGYSGPYIEELAEKATQKLKKIDFGDPQSARSVGQFGVDTLLAEVRDDLEVMGIHFDVWTHEKTILVGKKTEKVIEALKKKGATIEKEGALWFVPPEGIFSSSEDRESVLVRSSGQPTYFANDIAYHADKFDRGFDLLIDVWGSNHHGHAPRLKAALGTLGYDPSRLEVLLYQYVRVKRGSDLVKMSKRAGDFVIARDILDEVGRDAFRFFLLMRSGPSHMDFDLDLAKRQSSENPVFYVQYAHARICSIQSKAEEKGLKPQNRPEQLVLPEEIFLIRTLHEYPHELSLAIREKAPHRITYYLISLSQQLQSYYAKAKEDSRYHLLSQNVDFASAKLYLLGHVRRVLKDGLNLLGVSAPERMDSNKGELE